MIAKSCDAKSRAKPAGLGVGEADGAKPRREGLGGALAVAAAAEQGVDEVVVVA